MIIKKHRLFDKSYSKLHKKLKEKVNTILVIFSENPTLKSLNNHALKGDYIWFRSINATGDYRIVFRELSSGTYELVELIDIGTHSELYK